MDKKLYHVYLAETEAKKDDEKSVSVIAGTLEGAIALIRAKYPTREIESIHAKESDEIIHE
jgi:hypothetical protein